MIIDIYKLITCERCPSEKKNYTQKNYTPAPMCVVEDLFGEEKVQSIKRAKLNEVSETWM